MAKSPLVLIKKLFSYSVTHANIHYFTSQNIMGRVIHKKETEQESKPGLYVISTPIGNLQDLSLRAQKILEQCELVLAEGY